MHQISHVCSYVATYSLHTTTYVADQFGSVRTLIIIRIATYVAIASYYSNALHPDNYNY